VGVTWKILFSIIALLSINLWVLNILPFPALDGGRLVSTTIRSIIGLFYKKTKTLDVIEYSLHAFGMIALLFLSLLIALLDISKFF
jgi:regulator of sigma E protease